MKIAITSDIYYPMTNGVAVFAHNLANFDVEVIDYTGEEIETITEEAYKEPEAEDAGNNGEEETEGEHL